LESEFFLSKYNKELSFLPAQFCEWALISNMVTNFFTIEKWQAFEYGEINLDENDFRDIIFDEQYSQKTDVLFISDESLKMKTAFSFKLGAFEKFVTHYEEMFEMDFFQPEDYIVYLRDYKILKIIHHEGKLIKISNSAMSNTKFSQT
jgi:hypothetical protein